MTLEHQPIDYRPAIQEVLGSPGLPLEPAVRTLMEARFVRDFGHVRLHTDDQAAASARAIGAGSYTVGSHIVFAEGRYRPGTRAGLWLPLSRSALTPNPSPTGRGEFRISRRRSGRNAW